MRDDHVRAQSYDLGDISTDALGVAPRPAIVDLDITACTHGPAELPQIIKQRGNFSLPDRVVFKPRDYHADAPPLGLLRPPHSRPRRRSAEQRDEVAPFQWQCLPCFQPEDITARDLLHCGISSG